MKQRLPKHAHHIVNKDLHLVGAAMATDERVISDDDKVRAHFKTLAAELTTLGRVHWVNPSDAACLPWLASGAPDDRARQLDPR